MQDFEDITDKFEVRTYKIDKSFKIRMIKLSEMTIKFRMFLDL